MPRPENIPRDVVCVIDAHLHFDRCGGNRLFPVCRSTSSDSSCNGLMSPVNGSTPGREYVERDSEAEVLPGIRLLPTPGHTDGHQSVLVDTPDGLVVIDGTSHTRTEDSGAPRPKDSGTCSP